MCRPPPSPCSSVASSSSSIADGVPADAPGDRPRSIRNSWSSVPSARLRRRTEKSSQSPTATTGLAVAADPPSTSMPSSDLAGRNGLRSRQLTSRSRVTFPTRRRDGGPPPAPSSTARYTSAPPLSATTTWPDSLADATVTKPDGPSSSSSSSSASPKGDHLATHASVAESTRRTPSSTT